jgi:hypothetical protein
MVGMAALLFGATLGSGAPLDMKARAVEAPVDAFGAREFWGKFPGGKRSLAIALGDNRTNLGLYVFDAHGNCVARDDDMSLASRDDLAVEWLPAQTGLFTIQVKSLARISNRVLLVIRQR